MKPTTLIAASAATLAAAVAMLASAGDLNPPPGPVSPTGPSLSDINNNINNINAGADVSQVENVVNNAANSINENINALQPRGESFYELLLRMDGINGTSSTPGYTGFVEISTVEFETGTVLDSGPGMNFPGMPMISGMKIVSDKPADANMSRFFGHCALGSNVSCDLAFVQPFGNTYEVMTVSFDASFVTHFRVLESGYELTITPIGCVTVTSHDINAQGQLGPPVTNGWDISNNVPCN